MNWNLFKAFSNWEINKGSDLYLQFVSQVRAYGENTLVKLY